MSPHCVTAMLRWLLLTPDEIYDYTKLDLAALFREAHLEQFGYWNEFVISVDVEDFRKRGHVPYYMVLFLRTKNVPQSYRKRET